MKVGVNRTSGSKAIAHNSVEVTTGDTGSRSHALSVRGRANPRTQGSECVKGLDQFKNSNDPYSESNPVCGMVLQPPEPRSDPKIKII